MCLVHCPDSSDCERHLVPDDGPQQLHQPDHLRGLLLLRETSQSFCQHKHHTGHDSLLQQATTIGQEVIWSFHPRRNTRKSERRNDREAESPNLTLTSSLSPSLPVVTTSIWNTVTKPPPPRAWCQNSKCWQKILLPKKFQHPETRPHQLLWQLCQLFPSKAHQSINGSVICITMLINVQISGIKRDPKYCAFSIFVLNDKIIKKKWLLFQFQPPLSPILDYSKIIIILLEVNLQIS